MITSNLFQKLLSYIFLSTVAAGLLLLPTKTYTEVNDENFLEELSKQRKAAYYFSMAKKKHQNGDYRGAVMDYSVVLELFPEDSRTYVNMGDSKKSMKKYADAIVDYSKAIEFKPQFEQAYFKRGKAYLALNKNENGCEDFSQALVLGYAKADEYINRYCLK